VIPLTELLTMINGRSRMQNLLR